MGLYSRQKLSIILALLIILGFGITSWLSYNVAHNSLQNQLKNETLPFTSDNIYSEIQQDLLSPVLISSIMAQDTFVRRWALEHPHNNSDSREITQYLTEIQSRNNIITSFFISDLNKRYYHPSGGNRSVSKDDPEDAWYFRALNLPTGKNYEINIDKDKAFPDRWAVFVNHKVYDFKGNVIGITGVGLGLDRVKEIIESYQKQYQRSIYFVSKDGEVTLSDGSLKYSNIFQEDPIKDIAKELLSNKRKTYSYEQEGQKVFVNSHYIKEFDWYLIVEQRVQTTTQALSRTLKVNILLALIVTAIILTIAHFAFNNYQRRLESMATTDKLSGAFNRTSFDIKIAEQIAKYQKQQLPFTLILLDIDHFKAINDKFGHIEGDKVIQGIARVCQESCRENDSVCRWGGEEFLILLPDTKTDEALTIARRIQKALSNASFIRPITASLGVAEYRKDESLENYLVRLDEAMYSAKNNGRNRVEIAS